MVSVLDEIQQDVRQEKLVRNVKRFGPWVGGVTILGILLIVVMQYLQDRGIRMEAEATHLVQKYQLDEESRAETLATLKEIGSANHLASAAFADVSTMVGAKEYNKAVQTLDTIAKDSAVAKDLQHYAGTMALFFILEHAPDDASIANRFADLTALDNPWHLAVKEWQAWHLFDTGEQTEAKKIAEDLVASSLVTSGMKERLRVLLQQID